MDVKEIDNMPKKKSKVDVCEQNTPTSTKVNKSNEREWLMALTNSSQSKEKSSSPVKLQNCLKFDYENIDLPRMGITGNSPKRKRKFDICEKNTLAAKKVMGNFSKSNKESNLVQPGNDLGLKFDCQNVIAGAALFARRAGELDKIMKVTPEELQRTPGKQAVVKQTRWSVGTTSRRSPSHHPVLTLHNKGNTTTPCPLSPSPGPSSQNNSSVASISSGSNSSVINMAVPCTLASIPIDMHDIAYQNLQQTTHLQGQDFGTSLSRNPGTVIMQRVRHPDSNSSFQSDTLQTSAQISKKDVFDFMINTFDNGYAAISDTQLLNFFKADELAVTAWISKEKSNFRLLHHKNGNISVSVYDVNVEPCQQFWSENGCHEKGCGRFHICKKVILQIPHNKHTCRFCHEFHTSSNDKLIEENDLANLTYEQVLILLRNRYPKVCKDYQSNRCSEGIDFCQKLHVCLDLVLGNCKKSEAICGLLHENGLRGKQYARLRQEFNLEQDCFPLCLYYEDIVIAPRFTTEGSKFNAIKEEAICSKYISGKCKGKTCHLYHPHVISQYVWQRRKKETESWEDIWQTTSERLEKVFCDPNSDHFIYKSNLLSFAEDVNGIFSSSTSNVELRRLSTKSSVLGDSSENYLTQWKWYWKQEDNDWREYKSGTSSSQIEMAYLKANNGLPANSIKFSVNRFSYEIDFVKMKQKNLDPTYGTKREIRRRPVFSSVTNKNSAQIHLSVPTHWPSSCKPGTRIPITDQILLSKWEAWFTASIGFQCSIISIKEVCNVDLFQIYQSKKMLMEKNGASSNERWLFHGSESSVINDICAQNLDWRLCGLNGTAYGQGTYFARNASYGDWFSKPDSSGYKYMFIAQVLVGQFTTGSSSYKRPPVRDNTTSELFDSVVNNTSSPSIFVIFERNQCYPRYLVKYKYDLENFSYIL